MRDPIKILQHRATKVPAIREFLNAIDEHSLKDIESLDIKKSDKKLLRTHFDRFAGRHREAELNASILAALEQMPKEEAEEIMYRIYVYEGPEMTYNGYEIRTGDIVSLHDDWIRFDYYRIKIKGSVEPILDYCKYVDTLNITATNQLIFKMINARHGGSSTAMGDQYAVGGFRIQRH